MDVTVNALIKQDQFYIVKAMASDKIEKYGLLFFSNQSNAEVERFMIQGGGQWFSEKKQKAVGRGLEFHFKKYWEALWPDDSQTWWTDLILREVLQNQFTSLVGGASSWKSTTIAKIALMDWSCFPDCTTIMISSTTMKDLRGRIYSDVVKSWQSAKDRHEWFPGHVIDSQMVITEKPVEGEEEKARDIRNGIIAIACQSSSGAFIGMRAYAGRKNRRVWCIGDEFQFMLRAILDAQDNLVSNGPNLVAGKIRDKEDKEFGKPIRGYKAVFIANPNPTQPDNPSNYISEPEGGWQTILDDHKTKVWDCRKLPDHPVKCRCLNLNGYDSPNTPFPIDKPKWPQLSGPHKIQLYTEGSESYWSQGVGEFKFGLAKFKIITVEDCTRKNAFGDVIWDGRQPTIKIGGCDAAYSGVGGDRCAVGWGEFGKCVDGFVRFKMHPWMNCPVIIRPDVPAEHQIAIFCKTKMEQAGVPPQNFFFDGRGTLAVAMSQMWSPQVTAIEFGGKPTDRLVAPGIYANPQKSGEIRHLAAANEYYDRFVAELWFFMNYTVAADQMRGLTMDVVLDAAPREWKRVTGDKVSIETKEDMKKRTGVSPDLGDLWAILLEGARRRGFQLSKLNTDPATTGNGSQWLIDMSRRQAAMVQSRELTYR